jgi:hypothetical protein
MTACNVSLSKTDDISSYCQIFGENCKENIDLNFDNLEWLVFLQCVHKRRCKNLSN